ncbi:hypothetical protein [Pseudoalteromonas sp. MTN2-4]|uniref:hypothetical protein n=1 Tax=Pseudoalteromonas sp. MTN2-4 TaxID=3056555 RepID=UPI0036F249D3
MRELNVKEIEAVNGGGDGWDAASGGLTGAGVGAGAVGVAVAVGATVAAPVTIGVIAVSAAVGAVYSWFSE